ncbi:MYND-type domain-containing protein [Mycena kentingensis (nom. inval.)]|nr:MYND-type domain-containing protein [Mycena kentingensis (nom. inval.)]
MHPSLHLDRLQKLPSHIQSLAKSASQGSLASIQTLKDQVYESRIPERYWEHLVPALFAILDPTSIQSLLESCRVGYAPQLDTATKTVILALKLLSFVFSRCHKTNRLPGGIFEDIWARLWAWMEFFELAAVFVSPAPDTFRATTYALCVQTLRWLCKYTSSRPEYHRIVFNTAGAIEYLGAAWSQTAGCANYATLECFSLVIAMYFDVSRAPIASDSVDPYLGALVHAVGSSSSLARTVVTHILGVLSHPIDPSDHPIFDLQGVFELLHRVLNPLRSRQDYGLPTALADAGIVGVLVATCRRMVKESFVPRDSDPALAVMDDVNNSLLTLLILVLGHIPRRQERVCEALRAGLVSFLGECPPALWSNPKTGPKLKFIVSSSLRECLVFHSTLSALRPHFAEMSRIMNPTLDMPDEDFVHDWQGFLGLAKDYFEILDSYEQGSLTKYRACDNLSCGAIREKHGLKRCAGCLTAYYCSKRCQKRAYRVGGHREDCDLLQIRRRELCADIGPKDRAFLRAILHNLYESRKDHVAMGLFTATKMQPNHVPYTVFNLSGGNCEIRVISRLEESIAAQITPAHLAKQRPGAGGDARMDMHLLEITGRTQKDRATRFILMPMRSQSTKIHDAIRWLAERTEHIGEDQVGMLAELHGGRIDEILTRLPVLQIH